MSAPPTTVVTGAVSRFVILPISCAMRRAESRMVCTDVRCSSERAFRSLIMYSLSATMAVRALLTSCFKGQLTERRHPLAVERALVVGVELL